VHRARAHLYGQRREGQQAKLLDDVCQAGGQLAEARREGARAHGRHQVPQVLHLGVEVQPEVCSRAQGEGARAVRRSVAPGALSEVCL
jgi:hypothetical protein